MRGAWRWTAAKTPCASAGRGARLASAPATDAPATEVTTAMMSDRRSTARKPKHSLDGSLVPSLQSCQHPFAHTGARIEQREGQFHAGRPCVVEGAVPGEPESA